MKASAWLLFLLPLAAAVAFVWITGRTLPQMVATHFNSSGAADAFMPRALYLRAALLIVVALPSALVLLPAVSLRAPNVRMNLPNADYWLAPPHRAQAIGLVRQYLANFGSILVLFLAYAHWLVVHANAVVPPNLPMSRAIGALVVFALIVIIWATRFIGRFRREPRMSP